MNAPSIKAAPGAAMRSHFPIFQSMPPPFHFLDNASTGQICAPALNALVEFESTSRANVKRGVYSLADKATQSFEHARNQVAHYLGVENPDNVVLTSGTTQGLNIMAGALAGSLRAGDQILISELEHHSNIVPWQLQLKDRGVLISPINVRTDGSLDLDELEQRNSDNVKLIAVTHVSNVTGAVTDLERLSAFARRTNAYLIVDGAQRAAHGPIDVPSLGCHAYAISSHKLFGPTGAGALWIEPSIAMDLPPFMGGGEMIARVGIEKSSFAMMPHRFEAGTPPIGAIIGMGAAVGWLSSLPWPDIVMFEQKLTKMLINCLENIPQVVVFGPKSVEKRFGVVAFEVRGVHAHDVCQMLGDFGVCLRGGHHCAQPLMERLDVQATARASLAFYNDADDVKALIDGLKRTIDHLS